MHTPLFINIYIDNITASEVPDSGEKKPFQLKVDNSDDSPNN